MSFQRAPFNDTQLEIPLTFSLHFSQTPAGDSSLPSSGNIFFNKIPHSSQCKWIFWLVESAFFCSEVFPFSETIAEISGSQFLKEDQILTIVTDFLAGGAIFFHFIRQQSTATSGSSLCYKWSIFFSQSFILASTSKFFVYWKHYRFFLQFFLLVENIIEIRLKSTFKDVPYSC